MAISGTLTLWERFVSDETESYFGEKYDSVSHRSQSTKRSQIMCKIHTRFEDGVSAVVLKYDTEPTQIVAIVNLREICHGDITLGWHFE